MDLNNLLVNSADAKVRYTCDLITELCPMSEYELGLLKNAITLINQDAPAGSVIQINSRIDKLRVARENIDYILLRLRHRYNQQVDEFNEEYMPVFNMLTRQGRPSAQAINSEIFTTKKHLKSIDTKIKNMESMSQYLVSLGFDIDKSVSFLSDKRSE